MFLVMWVDRRSFRLIASQAECLVGCLSLAMLVGRRLIRLIARQNAR